MKYTSPIVFALFALGTVGLAFVHPFGNPRIEPHEGLDTLLHGADVPNEARKVLLAKCGDCHSNETHWPAYARVAPASWIIERDVTQARAKMNLSHWGEMSSDTRSMLIGQILQEAKDGDMPPLQYRVIHWGAQLGAADITALQSMNSTSLEEQRSNRTGDATNGKALFQRRCTGCHALDGDREGPHLAGVFGRKAGGVTGFDYSAGLKNSGITWNESTLERWLAAPDLIAPDTKMEFHVPKPQERADLIAYLRQ